MFLGSQDRMPMGTLSAFEFCSMLARYQPQAPPPHAFLETRTTSIAWCEKC
jgi:hypothetical protein